MGSKYLKNALSVASLAYISWFLIIDNGEAIFQDINDLVYDQLPLYNNFKINEAKAYDTLQLIYKEKEEGLEGYLREVLQTKSRYIEVMCTCNKYRSKFCGNLNDLNTEDMLQMINEDPDHFRDDIDTLKLYGETEDQFQMAYNLQVNEYKNSIKSYQRKQEDLVIKTRKVISYVAVLAVTMILEISWLIIGQRKYLRIMLILMLLVYIFNFLTLYLYGLDMKIERGHSGARFKLLFCLVNHLLFFAYLCLFRENWSEPKVKNTCLDSQEIRQWCANGSKDKLRKYLTENWHEIDINEIKNNSTPLHLAIKKGHISIVKVLFTVYGEKLNTGFRNEDGDNALDLTVKQRNVELFNLLLKHSAVTHISSLILAVKNDEVKMIKDLISKVPRGKIIDIIKLLTTFCDGIDRLKDKNLPKNRRKELEKGNVAMRKNLLKKMENESNSEVDFICPSCKMVMKSPLKIYSCTKDHHLFCSECLENGRIKKCLTSQCLEDFTIHIPNRRLTSERLVMCLLEAKSSK